MNVQRSHADSLVNVVNIMIMRKETFSIHAENEMARDQLMKDLLDCIEFAATGECYFLFFRSVLMASPKEWRRTATFSRW
jgi:hypothetical protein